MLTNENEAKTYFQKIILDCFVFFTAEKSPAMPFGLSICAVIGEICTQSNAGEYQKQRMGLQGFSWVNHK